MDFPELKISAAWRLALVNEMVALVRRQPNLQRRHLGHRASTSARRLRLGDAHPVRQHAESRTVLVACGRVVGQPYETADPEYLSLPLKDTVKGEVL